MGNMGFTESDKLLYRMSNEVRICLGFLLLGVTFYTFRDVLKYPFIQDDWGILYSIINKDAWTYLSGVLNPSGILFYRPLGQIYIFLLYSIFGLNPLGYHVIALLIHSLNALIIAFIVMRISRNERLSWVIAFLYATAVGIHMDPLGWIVGIYDLLGAFFFMISFYLFLNNNRSLSVVSYLLALLTKEATVILPLILLFSTIFLSGAQRKVSWQGIKAAISLLRYHFITAVLFALFLARNIMQALSASVNDQYEVRFLGDHLLKNAYTYIKWGCQLFYPLYHVPWTDWFPMIATLLIAIVFLIRRKNLDNPTLLFYILWFMTGLLPVLVLPQHSYRYYLTYSLPALYLIVLSALQLLMREKGTIFTASIVLLLLFNIGLARDYTGRRDEHGFDSSGLEGTNDLPLKGALVKKVKSYLFEQYPNLGPYSVLVFDGMFSEIFGGNSGPRIWYGDSTLRVYDSSDIEIDSLGVYATDSAGKHFFDPKDVVVFTFSGDSLQSVRLSPP